MEDSWGEQFRGRTDLVLVKGIDVGVPRFLAQSVKCFHCRNEDLSLDPHYPCQKTDMVMHVCDS